MWIDPWGWCIRTNAKNGAKAEAFVLKKLQANPNVKVLGQHVYIKTPGAGRGRYVDILIEVTNPKTGKTKIVADEVKSGKATRPKLNWIRIKLFPQEMVFWQKISI